MMFVVVVVDVVDESFEVVRLVDYGALVDFDNQLTDSCLQLCAS